MGYARKAEGVFRQRIRDARDAMEGLRCIIADLEIVYQAQAREERPYSRLAKARHELRSAEKRERRAWRDLKKQHRRRDQQQRNLDELQEDLISLDEWLNHLETDNQTNLNPVRIVLRVDAGFSIGPQADLAD